jgi:hypothetical protein
MTGGIYFDYLIGVQIICVQTSEREIIDFSKENDEVMVTAFVKRLFCDKYE